MQQGVPSNRPRRMARREFLILAGAGACSIGLAACQAAAPPEAPKGTPAARTPGAGGARRQGRAGDRRRDAGVRAQR